MGFCSSFRRVSACPILRIKSTHPADVVQEFSQRRCDLFRFPLPSLSQANVTCLIWQHGTVTDGDRTYVPWDDCTWLIAPKEGSKIQITFSKLELGGIAGNDHETLEVMVCQDLACQNPVHVSGSPYDEGSNYFDGDRFTCDFSTLNGDQNTVGYLPSYLGGKLRHCVKSLPPIEARFIRVRFTSQTSLHTTARFVLHYSADFENALCSGLPPDGSWHHVSTVAAVLNSDSLQLSLYVNGSLKVSSEFPNQAVLPLSISGDAGIAVGRADSTHAPPLMSGVFGYYNDLLYRRLGADTYWAGSLDELRIWNHSRTESRILAQYELPCASVNAVLASDRSESGLLVCFDFERSIGMSREFEDSGAPPHSSLIPSFQDRILPWCVTRGDNGQLMDQMSSSDPLQNNIGLSWGHCTDKPRLPGLGFEYSEDVLLRMQALDPGSAMSLAFGCSNVAINMTGNTAERYIFSTEFPEWSFSKE